MPVEVAFATAALTEDNERGIATGRIDFCDRPYPGGESHTQVITRVGRCLADLPTRWSGRRVMLTGHLATCRALVHASTGHPIRDIIADDFVRRPDGFVWRPDGWTFRLPGWRDPSRSRPARLAPVTVGDYPAVPCTSVLPRQTRPLAGSRPGRAPLFP